MIKKLSKLIRPGMFFVILLIVGLILFYPMLDNFFVSDSFDWLLIGKQAQFPNYFLTNYAGLQEAGSYRPLITLVMSGMFYFFEKLPEAYHLLSLVLHILTSYCIYLIAILLLPRQTVRHFVGASAALLFLILPSHAEVVMWVAGYPDAFAALFIGLSIVSFLAYRKLHANLWLIFSIVFWILALMSKENAIVLPGILFLLDAYLYKISQRTRRDYWFKEIIQWIAPFAVIGVGYLVLRFFALGGSIGSYSVQASQINLAVIAETFAHLIGSFVLFDASWRIAFVDFIKVEPLMICGGVVLVFAILIFVLRKYRALFGILFGSFLISCLPVLIMLFDNYSVEGERFGYFPSMFLVLLVVVVITEFILFSKLSGVILIGLVVYSGVFLGVRHVAWQEAGDLSYKIIEKAIPVLSQIKEKHVVVLGLPEVIQRQAHVMRNGFPQAIALWYPGFKGKIERVPIYSRAWKNDFGTKIEFEKQDNGFLSKPSGILHGLANYESTNVISELWGYNYKNQTGNQIKLLFRQSSVQSALLKIGQTKVIYFSENQFYHLDLE